MGRPRSVKASARKPRRRTVSAAPKPAKPPARAVDLTVVAQGTHSFAKAVLLPPNSPTAILNNLICREITNPSEATSEPASPTVEGLKNLVKAISSGENLAVLKSDIERVAANQPEKADVFRAYLTQIDREVLVQLIEMRDRAVRKISHATGRHDVTVGEALVVWRTCNEQIADLRRSTGADEIKPIDTVTVVDKIDTQQRDNDRRLHQRWEGTTPQGRELIRKKLWRLRREMELGAGIKPRGLDRPTSPAIDPVNETVDAALEEVLSDAPAPA